MTKQLFLGIDTSNYTTSAALCSREGEPLYNGKKLLPVAEGQIGLRQSDAVFHHTRQLPELIEEAFRAAREMNGTIAAVGVSESPREAENSYMPCFLAGVAMARGISAALQAPVFRFSHQQGHVAAAAVSSGNGALLDKTFLAFHLSGGTTEALLVTPGKNGAPACQAVAASLDLKAGQAIDRVGVAMGLPFPAGKYIDQLACASEKSYRIRPTLREGNPSLSGVQNQCEAMLRRGETKEDVACFCISSVLAAVEGCLRALQQQYGELPVLFSGGVSSNSMLNRYFSQHYGACFARPEFSSDNAYGPAVLAARRFLRA